MKKIIFYLAIILSIIIALYESIIVFETITEFQQLVYGLLALYLLVFGAYGLYAEHLWAKFRARGKTENLCVEANYHVRNLGFLGRVFLFPFMKIKSSNSMVISFLGAFAWIVIISIILKVMLG